MNPDFSLSDWMKNWSTLNRKCARPLASDDRTGVAIAQLDLSNKPASSVNLAQDYRPHV